MGTARDLPCGNHYELGIGLMLCALVAAVLWRGRRIGVAASLALAACCGWFPVLQVRGDAVGLWRMERNFYGALLTTETRAGPAALYPFR